MLWKLLFYSPLLFVTAPLPQGLMSGPPPIKMGLWETTFSGDNGGPGYKARTCITAESYQNAFTHMPQGCTLSNESRTPSHFSADIACTFNGAQSSGHFEIDFPDSETVHSKTAFTLTMQGKTIPITSEASGRFISSDCGSVVPGKPQRVR